jgi:hypothetical protein
MKSVPAFSKQKVNAPVHSSGLNKQNKQRAGFTPHVKATVLPKVHAAPGLAGPSKHGGGPKSQIGGRTPGTKGHMEGRKVHAAKTPPAFSKKKI